MSPYIQNRPNLTLTPSSTETRTGFFKPVQIVKEIKQSDNNSIEHLPKPQSLSAYGLPAYNGPQDISQPNRRGPTHPDYVTTSAGFVPSPRSVSDQPVVYDMSGSSNINSYRARPSNNDGGHRSGYSPLESSSSSQSSSGQNDDLDAYMRAAASESQSQGSSPSGNHEQSSYSPYDSRTSTSSSSQSQQMSRRKPSSSNYGEEPFDPSQGKHYMKTHIVRDNDHGSSPFADHTSSDHHVLGSASNDNELAQLAASMSEFQPSSSNDFGGSSFGSSFGGDSMPSFGDSNVFASGSNFNPQLAPSSQGLMASQSFPNSIASVVPGMVN